MMEGLKTLKQYIKNAPQMPGVYRMLDKDGKVLYVGKAKNIQKRITSYSHIDKLPLRLQRMVSQIHSMEFIVVKDEKRALLLENELIKKLEPKYNILLKDDKSFPFLSVDLHSDYPLLKKMRGKKNKGDKVFGPFASVSDLNSTIDTLQKLFMLRSCTDTVFNNRSRPCLLHQIKLCTAPCVKKVTPQEYRQQLQSALDFLEGKNSKLQEEFARKMSIASQNQEYELAAVYRDKIKALTSIQTSTSPEYSKIPSADVVACAQDADQVCVEVFIIRNGISNGNISFYPKQMLGDSKSDILEAFLSSFYATHDVPKEIIVSSPLENTDFLQTALNTKIAHHKQGYKATLIADALTNANLSLQRHIALESKMTANLQEMQKVFGLEQTPKRIEVYDNSHNQGSFAVGSYIVATDSGFAKSQYRKFNIKNPNIFNDDFAMMKEVLNRRFAHMTEENRPDVILIDGGQGQLNAVINALSAHNTEGITFIGIAKGPQRNAGKETYHLIGKEPFSLPYQSSLAFYMQNIRDEAHRFAISTHRHKRLKSVSKSSLDEIEDIGPKRKKQLLHHFGNVEAISQASVEDLCKIDGINKKVAQKIFNFFHI